jgi:hypothetical protein
MRKIPREFRVGSPARKYQKQLDEDLIGEWALGQIIEPNWFCGERGPKLMRF